MQIIYQQFVFTMWLWKESLNSDSHQFHQYQLNEQSPLILNELTEHKKIMTYDVGNPSHGLGQAQKCGWPWIEPVTGIPTLLMFFVIICLWCMFMFCFFL